MSVLAGRLRDLGAQVIEMPAIRTEMITPNEPLREALVRFAEMKQQRWLVFTSPIGVSVFFDLIREMRMDLRDIFGQNRVKIGAIGSATGAALEKHGLFRMRCRTFTARDSLVKNWRRPQKPGIIS